MTKTKMKKSTTTQHRLPLYRRAWFLALIIIVIIAAIVCAIIFFVKPSQTTSADAKTDDQSETSDAKNIQPDGQHDNEDEPYSDPDQITVQYEGENPNRASELSGNITYTDYSNGVLSIGTMINQYLGDGVCELKLIGSNGNTYTATSNIFAAASTSACYDLSVNVVPDSYQIEILLTSGEKQGTITGEISL